jgi:hypothetical protein
MTGRLTSIPEAALTKQGQMACGNAMRRVLMLVEMEVILQWRRTAALDIASLCLLPLLCLRWPLRWPPLQTPAPER